MGFHFCTRKEPMLKKTITYTNFNDEEVTETLYFNFLAKEVYDMMGIETNDKGEPINSSFQEAAASGKLNQITAKVSDMILDSYGVRSEDGREFIKTPELRESFGRSMAYDTIFQEMTLGDENDLVNFLLGIMPKKLADQLRNITVTAVAKET
jgi:hypothetical protein